MTERITDNVFRIAVPLPGNPLKELNSYFIKGQDKNLLIDTGFNTEPCRVALHEGLDELGADMKATDIYITHLHSDHIGLAPEILSPGCKIYITRTDCDIILKGMNGGRWELYDEMFLREGFSREELDELVHKNPARAYAPTTIPEFTFVSDGDVLEYGGMKLEVICVPGHTPGNTVLYAQNEKIMFLGDHVLFNITPNIISWLELDNSLKCYCDSLRRIRGYDVQIPLPAHRGVSCTTAERIDQILLHHDERLAEALGIVTDTPGQNAYELASKMTWQIRTSSNKWCDFPIGQKWFAVGEVLSHMEYLMAEGKVLRKSGGEHNGYFPA